MNASMCLERGEPLGVSAGGHSDGLTGWLTLSCQDGRVNIHSLTPEQARDVARRIVGVADQMASGTPSPQPPEGPDPFEPCSAEEIAEYEAAVVGADPEPL